MSRRTTEQPNPGVALRQRRQAAGLTTAQVAEAASVSVQVLEDVELGVRSPGRNWMSHVERVVINLSRDRQAVQR